MAYCESEVVKVMGTVCSVDVAAEEEDREGPSKSVIALMMGTALMKKVKLTRLW